MKTIDDQYTKMAVREMPYRWDKPMSAPPEFEEFFRSTVLPLLNIPGRYKREAKKRESLDCAFNLFRAGLENATVAKSRTTQKSRNNRYDELSDAGLCRWAIGSEDSNKVSRLQIVPYAVSLTHDYRQSFLSNADDTFSDLIIVTSKTTDPKTGQDIDEPVIGRSRILNLNESIISFAVRSLELDLNRPKFTPNESRDLIELVKRINQLLRWMRAVIADVNDENADHIWSVNVAHGRELLPQHRAPSVMLRQQHSEELFRCARLYTPGAVGQSMTKEQRATMTIDREETIEIDFQGMHPRILYHLAGIDFAGDPYMPDKVFPVFYASNPSDDRRKMVRNLVKSMMMSAINASRWNDARGSVFKDEIQPNKELQAILIAEGMTVGGGEVLNRIVKLHTPIKSKFFTGAGDYLMTFDGFIILKILFELASIGIPAFPLHDSIRVKISDRATAEKVMRSNYRKMMNFDPILK